MVRIVTGIGRFWCSTDNNHFVGKLSQHDLIAALEPNYKEMKSSMNHGHPCIASGLSDGFAKSTLEQYHLWEKALENLCEKAIHLKVKDIMYTPEMGEFVNASTTLDEAIHRLIVGRHHSLLVTSDHDAQEIVGVLRIVDVFEFAVCDAMHECAVA